MSLSRTNLSWRFMQEHPKFRTYSLVFIWKICRLLMQNALEKSKNDMNFLRWDLLLRGTVQ